MKDIRFKILKYPRRIRYKLYQVCELWDLVSGKLLSIHEKPLSEILTGFNDKYHNELRRWKYKYTKNLT